MFHLSADRARMIGILALGLVILGRTLTAEIGEPVGFQIGSEQPWTGPGGASLRLFVPEDYVEARDWPLLYVFHGTGGRASTRMFQEYTGGRGYVIIAAPYAMPGEGSLSREGVLSEIRRIQAVREALGRSLRLDGRVFVGGFSKGGWMSDLLIKEGFPGLSGGLILGAGRIPVDVGRALDRPSPKTENGNSRTHVYVGIGQLDTNHVYSFRAEQHYRGLTDHEVILEEYWAKAHRPGEAACLFLHQWLRLRAVASVTAEERQWATDWWDAAVEQSEQVTPPMERLLYLETVARAPLAKLLPENKRETLERTLNRVRGHRALRAETDAQRAYLSAQKSEREFKRSEELVEVAHQFHRVYQRFPKTFFGQRAALDVERVSKNARTLRASAIASAPLRFPEVAPDERGRILKRFERFGALLHEASGLSKKKTNGTE